MVTYACNANSQEAQTGSELSLRSARDGGGGRENEGNPTNEVLFPPTSLLKRKMKWNSH